MVYICDFDDSFTYNIFSELKALDLEVSIIEKGRVNTFLETHINTHEKLAIVLGPGPGHPDDYQKTIEVVGKLLNRENMLLMGVCLGHQFIARALGLEVEKSSNPKHGEVELIKLKTSDKSFFNFDHSEIKVQRYNSLAAKASLDNLELLKSLDIECVEFNSELIALKSNNFISYQFHPESVGTSFRSLFFRPLKSFLL